MKKIFGTAATALICLGMLSGCGNNEAAETFPEISATSAETENTSVSSAALRETVSEVTETTTAETKLIEEVTTSSEAETSAETEQEYKLPYEIVDMSSYTGNFYEWEYDYDIVAYNRESFAGGEDIINAAERTVTENFKYEIYGKSYTYDEVASLAEKAEKSEEYGGYIFEVDGERVMLFNNTYERFSDENGKLDPRFAEGVYEDFDGDGKKESFLCFNLFNLFGGFSNARCCVVFVDSEGNAELLPRADGELFDWGNTLNPMRYNGFLHICTAFGVNNLTHHSEIYAIENGKTVHKKTMFSPAKMFCGAFMLESAAQAPGSWISLWNEEEKNYFTLSSENLTDEEVSELFNSAAFKESKSLSEIYESAEQLKNRSGVTGRKYYDVSSGGMWVEGFERTSDGFKKSEYEIICPYHENEIYAVGVDINKAEAEMIRLEK